MTSTERTATTGKVMVLGLLLTTAMAALVLALSVLASTAESATPDPVAGKSAGASDDASTHAKASGGSERKQQLNVVQCPTGGSQRPMCRHTAAGDALIAGTALTTGTGQRKARHLTTAWAAATLWRTLASPAATATSFRSRTSVMWG